VQNFNFFQRAKNGISRFFSNINIEKTNPAYDVFSDIEDKDSQEIDELSVIVNSSTEASNAQISSINSYRNYIYGSLSNNKSIRLNFFRSMSKFPEVSDAIDEICDAFFNVDDNNYFVNLAFNQVSLLNEIQKNEILKQFEQFISLFNFENKHFEYCREFVIDGELAWENVVDPADPGRGIIGIRSIANESFELIIDTKKQIGGILINSRVQQQNQNKEIEAELRSAGFANVSQYYSPLNAADRVIPMPLNQVTYIYSGITSPDKFMVYPVLERARRAYRQLILIEDAIIIYRLVRSPERLLFNVNTGKLPPQKAEQLVYQLMKRFQTKKFYDSQRGTVTNEYDPHQMLENYWFPKPEGTEGTSVQNLTSAVKFGELDDLKYFLRKLYLSLKIPFNRFDEKGEGGGGGTAEQETISYEEYRFAKFIMRIQSRFAQGLMNSFMTHLKLVGLWDQYGLNSRQFNIKFNPPSAFELYMQQKLINLKVDNYKKFSESPEFSKDLAMLKYLKLSETEIEENHARVKKEQIRAAILAKEIEDAVAEYSKKKELQQKQAEQEPKPQMDQPVQSTPDNSARGESKSNRAIENFEDLNSDRLDAIDNFEDLNSDRLDDIQNFEDLDSSRLRSLEDFDDLDSEEFKRKKFISSFKDLDTPYLRSIENFDDLKTKKRGL